MTQDIFEAYETDRTAERQGVKVRAELLPDAVFIIARAGGANDHFAKEGEKRFRPYRQAIEKGKMESAEAIKLATELFVDTQLKGWEGINVKKRDAEGKVVMEDVPQDDGSLKQEPVFEPLPFTRENALKLFKQLPELSNELQRKAQQMATFQKANIENDAKNS